MWRNLPSQNRVTSVRLSLLNKFENVVARLLPKLFHLRQNCCWWESMMPPLGSTPWPSPSLSQPPSNGYLPSWSRSCPIARPATQKAICYQQISLSFSRRNMKSTHTWEIIKLNFEKKKNTIHYKFHKIANKFQKLKQTWKRFVSENPYTREFSQCIRGVLRPPTSPALNVDILNSRYLTNATYLSLAPYVICLRDRETIGWGLAAAVLCRRG